MDLLQNKKALAGIIAGVVLMMVLMFVVILPMMEGGGEEAVEEDATVAEAPAEAAPTESAYPGGGPATVTDAAGGEGTAATGGKALPPLYPNRTDPFASIAPRPRGSVVTPRMRYERNASLALAQVDPLTIYNPRPTAETDTSTFSRGQAGDLTALTDADTGPDTTQRRMAGLVVGKNAYAILEVDGQTAVVKPGDILPDLSRVERIERDRILLRRGNRPIFVPLSANPNAVTGGGGTGYTSPTGASGYRPGGGYPTGSGYPTGASGYRPGGR